MDDGKANLQLYVDTIIERNLATGNKTVTIWNILNKLNLAEGSLLSGGKSCFDASKSRYDRAARENNINILYLGLKNSELDKWQVFRAPSCIPQTINGYRARIVEAWVWLKAGYCESHDQPILGKILHSETTEPERTVCSREITVWS